MMQESMIEGYRDCHVCTVQEKTLARKCYHCVGQFTLRDALYFEMEKRWRRKSAPILSALVPGLGHWYSGRRYIGTYFFAMAPLSVGLILATYQKWSWGLSTLSLSFILIWILAIIDSKKGTHRYVPPCQEACPGKVPCSKYVHLIARGMNLESLELVETVCPFPGTIGRICHHPCERECNRGIDGEPVAICTLKRYVDDNVERPYNFYKREIERDPVSLGKKIAIVGAGPAGLSAAVYLKLFGFDVSVFEARDSGGGTPARFFPTYRLPKEIYQREVDRILELDLDLNFGKALGEDFSVKDLESQGFSGVFLAMGASRSIHLPHTGDEGQGFLDGREFLERVVADEEIKLEGDVLVIGGGNVAMDVARSAARCGADKVRIVCLEKIPVEREREYHHLKGEWTEIKQKETGEYMPAHQWEIDYAISEGIEILEGGATLSFDIDNGKVVSANCQVVERIDQDAQGRLIPILKDNSDFTINADWVITAVGSAPDMSFMGGKPTMLRVVEDIPIALLQDDNNIAIPVLAGGDMPYGPSSVIEAITSGKEAAFYFYRKLIGSPPVSVRHWRRKILEPWANYADSADMRARRHEVSMPVRERVENFGEVMGGFTEDTAIEEADRCMRCDWPLVRESKVRKFFRMLDRSGEKENSRGDAA